MNLEKNHQKIKKALDGRTQKWLREKTGINQSDLSLIYRGLLTPSKSQADKIKDVLGVDLYYYENN